jgi:hypothetical protein
MLMPWEQVHRNRWVQQLMCRWLNAQTCVKMLYLPNYTTQQELLEGLEEAFANAGMLALAALDSPGGELLLSALVAQRSPRGF